MNIIVHVRQIKSIGRSINIKKIQIKRKKSIECKIITNNDGNETKNKQKQNNNITGTLAPPANSIRAYDTNGHPIYLPPWISEWLNLNVVVPLIALVVIIVGLFVICIALTRRRSDARGGPKDVYCRFSS